MSALSIGGALVLAMACSPQTGPAWPVVAPDVLLSVAYTESGLDPLAVHDNVTGAVLHPSTRTNAIALTRQLIAAGHRPDLGLMQINSPANLTRNGLTIESAFDPCASIHAGAQILLDDYQHGTTVPEKQVAVLRALSAYNTGNGTAGLATYVPAVLASARKIIPALAAVGLIPAATAVTPQRLTGADCGGRSGRRLSDTVFPCRNSASTLPPAAKQVFLRPAGGARELVFSAN